MRAMATAAVEAGLISGSKTSQEREAALFKLMEQGKLLSAEVLPAFGRQLSLLANENNGLALALDKNLSPALGRATNHFLEMQNAFFEGGWKEGLLFIIRNFNDQARDIKALFSALGGVVEQILAITVGKVQLVTAVILDMLHLINDPTSGLFDKFKSAAKLMKDGVIEGFHASPIGLQFEAWKKGASAVVGSDVNPLQWATGMRGQAPYAEGMAPRIIPTPYQPSGAGNPTSSYSNQSPATKIEVSVAPSDGMFEVIATQVENGLQGQFNSVSSSIGG